MDAVGGKWLKESFKLRLVQPLRVESYIAKSRKTITTLAHKEQYFPESFRPDPNISGHLTFMFKHEEIHLELLARLFDAIDPVHLEEWVRRESTGSYARRSGFFYEWLSGRRLDVEDVTQGNYVDALDPSQYFTATQINQVRRWRVRDNMPGSPAFCPVVVLSEQVRSAQDYDCKTALLGLEEEFGADLLLRSSVWLTIKESRASFAIEHEEDQDDRIKRFAMAMEHLCGEIPNPLSIPELEGLQKEILGENSLSYGVRKSPVFVGHYAGYRNVVDYIAPHWEAAPILLAGLSASISRTKGQASILRATIASFGFVYIHPMSDGNGRISRFLVNDILRRDGAIPKPFILPISATITHSSSARVGYDHSLEIFSKPLMMQYASNYRFADAQKYTDGVDSNFHFDAYEDAVYAWRYPNLTSHVEYMGKVIRQTIEEEMHNEALYIRNIHQARAALKQIMEGPDPLLDTIISSVWQNKRLSKALRKRFPILDNEERAARIVNAITNAFRDNPSKTVFDREDEDPDEDVLSLNK